MLGASFLLRFSILAGTPLYTLCKQLFHFVVKGSCHPHLTVFLLHWPLQKENKELILKENTKCTST